MRRLILFTLLLATPLGAQQRPQGDRFNAWDQDSNGKLVPEEVPEWLRKNFPKVDRDGDGFISRQEQPAA